MGEIEVLRINASTNAKEYFKEDLVQDESRLISNKAVDYYMSSKEPSIVGVWEGKGAQYLGLSGQQATRDQFHKLCDNIDPITGEQLNIGERKRQGYDFTFIPPKSYGILLENSSFEEREVLLEAFKDSVRFAMLAAEQHMITRPRRNGKIEKHYSPNLLYTTFLQFTGRPVNGVCDMLPHIHGFVFNSVFCSKTHQWRSGEFRAIKDIGYLLEGFFEAELSKKINDLGYATRRSYDNKKGKHSWEVDFGEETRAIIEKFSRRSAVIEAYKMNNKEELDRLSKELNIPIKKLHADLGAKTRNNKDSCLHDYEELRAIWRKELQENPDHWEAVQRSVRKERLKEKEITARACISYAERDIFERHASIEVSRLLDKALRYGQGHVTPREVLKAFREREFIIKEMNGKRHCYTRESLEIERYVVSFIGRTKGVFGALHPKGYKIQEKSFVFNKEQQEFIHTVARSNDQVTLLIGDAGSGKTSTLKEIERMVKQADKNLFAVAPTTKARNILRDDFPEAQTLALLLKSEKLQEQIKPGDIVALDECGLVGTKDMYDFISLMHEKQCRVLLVGDPKQHSPVAYGRPFDLICQHSGAKTVRLHRNLRQQGLYKKAVDLIAAGEHVKAFDVLDKQMGKVQEFENKEDMYREAAHIYVAAIKKYREGGHKKDEKAALIVSPTHREINRLNGYVREEMKVQGLLEESSQQYVRYTQLKSFTEEVKKDHLAYEKGMVIVFERKVAGGFSRGSSWTVTGKNRYSGEVFACNSEGHVATVPLDMSSKYHVYQKDMIELAVGDTIRFTKNGVAWKNGIERRIDNGETGTIASFADDGITLTNGKTIKPGFLTYGYCRTSNSAQGATTNKLIGVASKDSYGAFDTKLSYVTSSRGKGDDGIVILTDDKKALRELFARKREELTPMELERYSIEKQMQQVVHQRLFEQLQQSIKERLSKVKEYISNILNKDRSYQSIDRKTDNMRSIVSMEKYRKQAARTELHRKEQKHVKRIR